LRSSIGALSHVAAARVWASRLSRTFLLVRDRGLILSTSAVLAHARGQEDSRRRMRARASHSAVMVEPRRSSGEALARRYAWHAAATSLAAILPAPRFCSWRSFLCQVGFVSLGLAIKGCWMRVRRAAGPPLGQAALDCCVLSGRAARCQPGRYTTRGSVHAPACRTDLQALALSVSRHVAR